MFTGIVEGTATIRAREHDGDDLRLRLETPLAGDISPGDSIAINGVCLTAESVEAPAFEVYLAAETRERTYLESLEVGDALNVERPMPVDGRFDGHLVQGHVDGTATITEIRQLGEDWRYAISLPERLRPYVVEKGSITVDGISLTVAALREDGFEVAIIPETYRRTTLDSKAVGDPVHLEVDVIARYVERQLRERT